jgi:riboflavin kinase/FMN adenylyltransferase
MKEKTIYALGFFDGVHLGHQMLLAACRHLAEENACQSGAVTFTSHPDSLVSGNAPALLNTSEERRQLLAAYGMDAVLELAFDEKLMATPWSVFLTWLIDQGAAGFVCGEDFRFGAKGEGSAEKLAAFCEEQKLPYIVVKEQVVDGEKISSTRIRALLEQGQIEQANRLLGHFHFFTGRVVTGQQLGRTIGFPTANLAFPEGLLIPKFGVYACQVSIADEQDYAAVANIGIRPTVNGTEPLMELHLLDFAGDLYGKELLVTLHAFLRPEQKFHSLDELQAEIQKNVQQTRDFFEKSE